MCKFLESIPWLTSIQTLAATFTAYVAFTALKTWKHQAKAQRKTDFLDQLTDSVHDYIQSLSLPIEQLKFIYIGFESHKNLQPNSDQQNSHIIEYINSRGANDGKQLLEALAKSSDKVAKIESLVARGQVYGFKNYNICQKSVMKLNLQQQSLQFFASVIGTPSLNWEHPKAIAALENILTINASTISESLKVNNVNFIDFVKENYEIVYSGT
ncbi:hypothetical protein CXF85_02010 [Colwellia sp. 75C3]|uniref:hypothetical protein n=1 Tax=Colwellia sp. 75C3 TaxID=888425 RepID=UPI000C34EFFD|nr:hypothetical protein [Colwellia sp. 75C3]PKG85591.1 hypothetical protein CXF85_02010 [Colwellia sp. 75C3]